jgi:hypothetical protein
VEAAVAAPLRRVAELALAAGSVAIARRTPEEGSL